MQLNINGKVAAIGAASVVAGRRPRPGCFPGSQLAELRRLWLFRRGGNSAIVLKTTLSRAPIRRTKSSSTTTRCHRMRLFR